MSGKPTVLVVEDNDAVRQLMVEVLEREGLRVVACADLGDARASVRREHVDAGVIDYGLPDAIGPELFRGVGAPRFPHLFVSAWPHATERVCHGDDAWLEKPFAAAELVAAVRRLLRLEATPRRPVRPDPI